MKIIFTVLFIFFFHSATFFAQSNATVLISDVQIKNSWIVVFDSNGKKISQMPQSGKQVKGAAGDTFTVLDNGWIITYDKKCKEKNRRPA